MTVTLRIGQRVRWQGHDAIVLAIIDKPDGSEWRPWWAHSATLALVDPLEPDERRWTRRLVPVREVEAG